MMFHKNEFVSVFVNSLVQVWVLIMFSLVMFSLSIAGFSWVEGGRVETEARQRQAQPGSGH